MRLSEFIRKSQFPVMLALGTHAALACIAGYAAPAVMGYAWVIPALYVLLACVGLLLPGKARVVLGVLGTLGFFLPGVVALQGNAQLVALGAAVCYGALLFWSMSFAGWDKTKELPGAWLGICFTLLVVACFFTGLDKRLASLNVPVKCSFYSFVLLAMLSMNRSSRNLASNGKQGVSAAMRRKNIMLTVGMFAIALALALIPSLAELLQMLVDKISELLKQLTELFAAETEPTETVAATQAATMDAMDGLYGDLQRKETPPIVYTMILLIALGAAVPAVIYVSRKFGKALGDMLRRLYSKLAGDVLAEQEDFEDEITDIRKEGQESRFGNDSTQKRKVLSFAKMTPAQKIRYRYRKLAQKHPEWKAHNTARENLQEAAQLYEKARYSEHPIDEKDAARFKAETQ